MRTIARPDFSVTIIEQGLQGKTEVMRTLRKADDITRRDILTRIARTALGVSVVPFANELMNSVAHEQAVYLMRTSFKQIGSIRHPFLGAWQSL